MSTYTHINQDPVFNPVLGTTVPPRWEHLVSLEATLTPDYTMPGISRAIYRNPNATKPLHGEVWTASLDSVTKAAPEQTFKVSSGNAQMYVLSGSGSVTKNGKTIFLRDGEKVSFCAGDTFSFPKSHHMRILVRNEGASFTAATFTPTISALRPPTDADVSRLRAELGLTTVPMNKHTPRQLRSREENSSSGYARSKWG